MVTTDFVPARLAFLPDGMLLRTLFEYRYALQLLDGAGSSQQQEQRDGTAHTVERDVREAVTALEDEVKGRGLQRHLDDVGRFLSARSMARAA